MIENEMNHQVSKNQRHLWLMHFLLGLSVLLIGMNRNGGRKFVPANLTSLELEIEKKCQKMYINVLSTSIDEKDAFICCNELNSHDDLKWWDVLHVFTSYEYGICSPKLRSLPFVQSLSRFPHSWIIPIIPLLLRLLIIVCTVLLTTFYSNCTPIPLKLKLSTSMKRLFFYFCMMQFRGWILYIFMNDVVMKHFVNHTMGISISAMGEPQQKQQQQEQCWFTKHLRRNHDIECHGQEFDFSDHIVLFYAHFLPIIIMETAICYKYPLWSPTKSLKDQQQLVPQNERSFMKRFISALKVFLLTCVFVWFAYFNFVVYISAVSTTTYFHTVPESIVGYVLSLFVQIPIGLLLTVAGGKQPSKLQQLQCFVGLQLDREHAD